MSRSLQKDLGRFTLILTLCGSLLFTALASGLAYFRAKEVQDDVLEQIATWAEPALLTNQRPINRKDDERIVIQTLDSRWPLNLNPNLSEGFHYARQDRNTWRVLIVERQGGKIAVAQQTDLREEIAEGSATVAAVPILLLGSIFYLGVIWVVRKRLRPIRSLAGDLDARSELELSPINTSDLPTEIKPFTNAINRLLARTRDSIQRQQRFIADAAHELRTPVAGLSLLAENVQNAHNDQANIDLLKQGLDRLQSLVEQLLNLARLQADVTPTEKHIQADELLQQVVIDLYPLAEQKSIDLGVVQNDVIQVNDHDNGLWHIMQNSISNAIRYTPEGGQVDISLVREGDELVFRVTDTGPGIPEKDLASIFEPFNRGSQVNNIGNGLGLSIAKQAADQRRGTIKLSNRNEGGLVFEFRWPFHGPK
ncbi:MAG: sensor histidine kinase [Gammaproteobacteria bacterium]|nr:sensor histidine kinase [Gammaproteobacteria bacterium]